MMKNSERILTIDVMRGLTLFLMLFVNDLYSKGVPAWLTHRSADYDGMGLADWVFPGFLFMVGMSVPFAIKSRLNKGSSNGSIIWHILIRTISLLFIGVLMINVSRINPELTGISKNLWAILVYISIFLIWNRYRKLQSRVVYFLKGIGWAGLIILMVLFKAGTPEDLEWLKTEWWGILGLIAWGYLCASITYLLVRDNLMKTAVIWIFFIGMNVISQLEILAFLNFIKPVFGVIINGNIPSMVIAGMFFSLLLSKTGYSDKRKFVALGILLGILLLFSAFGLRNWFVISKIKSTPSWAMMCNGISVLLFIFLFYIIDVAGLKRWIAVFKPAGENSLTTYLAPDILYYSIWMSALPVFFYKNSEYSSIIILGSLVWALLMIVFATLLSKIGIRLKL